MGVNSECETSSLLCRCLNGDDAARAEFIARFGVIIERSVASKLAEMTSPRPPVRGDVEDVRNDILERLLRDNCAILSKLRDAEKINAWLITLSRNHVVDFVRKHSSRMRALELKIEYTSILEVESPAKHLIENERAEILSGQLAELPHMDRLIMELYYNHGLKYAEIAEITNQNINTVAAQLRRAKAKLRALLEPIHHEL